MTAPQQNIDWSLIRTLAELSAKAYGQSTATDAATAASALVVADGGDIYVAFQGSKAPRDFLQDGKFKLVPLVYLRHQSSQPCTAEVHHGFLEDFDALCDKVVVQVRNWLDVMPKARIYITGHSLGGGIAILCAFVMARQNFPLVRVITFGQPRVGNAAFKKLYNQKVVENFGCAGIRLEEITFHVVNADDPVPLLPPLLNGYRDEGNEIFLPRTPGYLVNPSIGLQLFDDVMGCFDSWRRGKLAFIPNHFIAAYQERIKDL
ncbi:MAG TPA: lipase family protein [Verrucomicrobiae bacterium]|nr:lipase family protein [Verrucomicrobiae bacterium]